MTQKSTLRLKVYVEQDVLFSNCLYPYPKTNRCLHNVDIFYEIGERIFLIYIKLTQLCILFYGNSLDCFLSYIPWYGMIYLLIKRQREK